MDESTTRAVSLAAGLAEAVQRCKEAEQEINAGEGSPEGLEEARRGAHEALDALLDGTPEYAMAMCGAPGEPSLGLFLA